ncbi:unnamed protein product, partial [Staurois parvus]
MYTDHQGTDDQCALMISVAPAVPPVSVHQCLVSVLISASCQCPSEPHQCYISMPTPISASISAHLAAFQCHPSAHAHQCASVPPVSASQCRLTAPVSAAYQCQSVPPI